MARSIAGQTEAELGGAQSVLSRQRRDHTTLDQLIESYHRTEGPARQEVLQELWRLVFPHAFAEEAVLWPVIRKNVADGEALTGRVEQEHQEINELVAELDRSSPGTPRFDERLENVFALLRQDARDEEDMLLAQLQDVTDERELVRLGRRWETVRRTAPTRAHPVVSRRPPGNALAALPLSVVDRVRDRPSAWRAADPAGRRRSATR